MTSRTLAKRITDEARKTAIDKLRAVHAEEYEALYRHERAVLETVYGYVDGRTTAASAQAASRNARLKTRQGGRFTATDPSA